MSKKQIEKLEELAKALHVARNMADLYAESLDRARASLRKANEAYYLACMAVVDEIA